MILFSFFFFLITKQIHNFSIYGGKKISIHVATIHSLSNQKSRPFSSSLCAKFEFPGFSPLPSPIYWLQKNLWNRKPIWSDKKIIRSKQKKIVQNEPESLSLSLSPRPPFPLCAYVCRKYFGKFVFTDEPLLTRIIGPADFQSASQFAISFFFFIF